MAQTDPNSSPRHDSHLHTAIDTVQSLVVAFVLAMTFRGFVAEGFVIPTGSMAPTLMGEHVIVHSEHTGARTPVGVNRHESRAAQADRLRRAADPMLGPRYPASAQIDGPPASRMGDRVLVLKTLYPFSEPQRFDVVVFKNPTDPAGPAANYIKRLIGLPGETIWLADGDVFAADSPNDPFAVQRKPEHVQRAVWQPVYDSDFIVVDPLALPVHAPRYAGPPWQGEGWALQDRAYRTDSAAPTTLRWVPTQRGLNDWVAYNMAGPHDLDPVSDLRIAAAITPDAAGLRTTLRLSARGHEFAFTLAGDEATVSMRPQDAPPGVGTSRSAAINPLEPGQPAVVEFWHVDQRLVIYLDGERIVDLPYGWSAGERLEHATTRGRSIEPQFAWDFAGSPVTLQRLRVDRDLHYRTDLGRSRPSFGTGRENLAELGPEHYFMLGDNSPQSLDSRFWGEPHPLIASKIDRAPFVVNRKLLLGKAWLVYFPAPLRLGEEGLPIIPDFGRLRFIR